MTDLHTLSFGDGARRVLAVHGITATAMAWSAVADALPPDRTLVAPDLRGRGHSRDLAGPWGLHRHADDVAELARETGARVLVGHSMGAYVAALCAAAYPDLFDAVVLVDGAVPMPLPPDADPDELLAAALGPALERLRETYPSVEDYVDFFRAHPALGPHWSSVVEDYVRYDALETADGVRSRALDEAVRADGRDVLLLGEQLDAALRSIRVPTHLLTAPLGMFGAEPPLLPPDAVAAYDAELAHLTTETVPGLNHYTILFDPAGAAAVARAVTALTPLTRR